MALIREAWGDFCDGVQYFALQGARVLSGLAAFSLGLLGVVTVPSAIFQKEGPSLLALLWGVVCLLIAAGCIFLVVLLTVRIDILDGVRTRQVPPKTQISQPTDERIATVQSYLSGTRALLLELEDDLATRTKVLEQVQADAERYGRLAAIGKEQADEIDQMVSRQLQRSAKSGIRVQLLFLIPAFLLGLLVNWVSGPILEVFRSMF